MGLDGVEIVMAVEDAFDIRIEDSEAGKLLTPRILIEFVQSKVAVVTSTTCLTHRAFNLLRKSLLRHGGLKRSDISPATSLSVLLPKPQRRAWLAKVMTDLGIKEPPALNRPPWLVALLFGASVLSGLFASVLASPSVGLLVFIIFGGVAILTGFIGAKLTTHQCTVFPKETQTVGDLSCWIMSHKADLADVIPSGWTRDQIALRVREIVVDNLGCESQYGEDARFVEDLGMG